MVNDYQNDSEIYQDSTLLSRSYELFGISYDVVCVNIYVSIFWTNIQLISECFDEYTSGWVVK